MTLPGGMVPCDGCLCSYEIIGNMLIVVQHSTFRVQLLYLFKNNVAVKVSGG